MILIPSNSAEPAAPIAEAVTNAAGEVTGFMATALHPDQVGNLVQHQAQPQAPEGGIAPAEPVADPGFEAPTSPAGYVFSRAPEVLPRGMHYDANQELGWRNFLHSEGVPAPIGKELSRLAMQGMLAKPQTDEQMAMGRQTAYAQLERMWGPDTDTRLAVVNRELTRMETAKPGLKAYLARTGLANSAWLAATIFNMAKAKGRIR